MRVLIVEDEEKAAQFLRKAFVESSFGADVVHDAEEALLATRQAHYDLLIVDITLPGMNGVEFVQQLRRNQVTTPVIQLTARDSVHDRVAGIEAGADIYLVKPFSISEVLAYARSLTQKQRENKSKQLKVADLEIDLERHRARRKGTSLDLTPKEFALLTLLVRRKGQVLPRSVIADEVWGINYDTGTNLVDVHIRRLRGKVDDPFEKKLIHTVRGSGYVLDEEETNFD